MSNQEEPSPQSVAKAGTLGAFFSSQAMLCLVTLMVFLGLIIALAPVGLSYLRQVESGVRSSGTRAAAAAALSCNPVLVTFSDNVQMGPLNRLLNRINASIAFGPNENGAFELAVSRDGAAAAVDALNRASDMVLIASLREQCH